MKSKNNYQVIMEFSPKAEEKNKQEVLEKVSQWFESKQAKVTDTKHVGTKQLVYEIKGFDKTDFWEVSVESEKPVKLTEVNVYLNRELQVIRYLVLKI